MSSARWGGRFVALVVVVFLAAGCSDTNLGSSCPLPAPFCGGDFPLNTAQTTPYGPPWADVRYGQDIWITCFGPYALCYYANCEQSGDGTAQCQCFDWFGTNLVLMASILNADVYQQTVAFCDANPGACSIPNSAPVCASINQGTFLAGATRISDFSFYQAAQEPIGSTDCSEQPGVYSGCMTAPCFGDPVVDPVNHTASLSCDCPTYDGPYQYGKSGASCDNAPLAYSAAYSPGGAPSNACDLVPGCVPDAPANSCGCPLYVPGSTVIPPDAHIDCSLVCQEYASCTDKADIQIGYTCDASLCTTEDRDIVLPACDGLQNCDLSEIFKAEAAAGCSCCASQLCGCNGTPKTEAAISAVNAAQRAAGSTPQCDINGTLCGLPGAVITRR